MPALSTDLRNNLERVVIAARDVAETGARAALEALAVHHHEPYPHMKLPAQRELRNHLRARARQLGDRRLLKPDAKGKDHEIDHLVGECAYEHWHRMLFARFLAENGLLIEPQENMAISLAEAEELAKEDGVDVWVFASCCAQRMLPQIFRPDDPLLQVSFATEHMLKLEKLLGSLSQAVFTASDALGWVYQFWQSKKKEEVNRSEVKIGADEIAAVTQLFTEPYMVEFLLHNTLGAWWAGKKLAAEDAATAKTEDELRGRLALPGVSWEYLRFVRSSPSLSKGEGRGEGEGDGSWRPAAGTFDGWPKTAAELKLLDPCGGSGHFLVAGLHHLVPIRMAEEGLSAAQAVDAVLRDNLHGLEIDERCCQIAAFAMAFAAWTYPDAGGYRPLPDLHIACTGIGPQCSKDQWLHLAEEAAARGGMPAKRDLFRTEESLLSAPLRNSLEALYELFAKAPILGSLIDPSNLPEDLFHVDYHAVAPLLAAILSAEKADDETRERAIAAAGMAKAAELLAGEYTLVITNVPYLGRGNHVEILRTFSEQSYPDAKADLATVFLSRSLRWLEPNGTFAFVGPTSWLFAPTYRKLRGRLLASKQWLAVARLGVGAFETITGHVVNVVLSILSAPAPNAQHRFAGLDASTGTATFEKQSLLKSALIACLGQSLQASNPDHRIMLEYSTGGERLSSCCSSFLGLGTGDFSHYGRCFWEFAQKLDGWTLLQGAADKTTTWGGLQYTVMWDESIGRVRGMTNSEREQIHNQDQSGQQAWGRAGVAVSLASKLRVSLFTTEKYDKSIAVLVPNKKQDLAALWTYCSSPKFEVNVRKLDHNVIVANGTLVKVPFDLNYWQKVAAEKYPDGLPKPFSSDPTQWLFNGNPAGADQPLHVAIARLLGYQWPRQTGSSFPDCPALGPDGLETLADGDGIVCITSVRGEEPAGDRLEALLAAAGIKSAKVRELAGGADLDDWLRNRFFEEHCRLFHDRPFVWHIWDGRKRDGFHALINYHKLCEGDGKGRKLLESLTYSYLGEWITRQKDGVKRGEGGAEDRLAAALELKWRLEAILEGEPPFDLFVRWKPLARQPIGWEPDINDGARLNIRPFLASDLPGGKKGAGVLRCKPNIKWTKDRGKEPERPKAEYPWFWGWDEKTEGFLGGKTFDGNRWNDCHYTTAAKREALELCIARHTEKRRGG